MKKKFRLLLYSLLFVYTGYSQNTLRGVIKDEKGVPVEAASVSVKGTNIFKVADPKGEFSIPSPKTFPFTLTVSSVGFAPAEVEIAEIRDSLLTIILFTNTELTELIITARRRVESAQNVPIPIK